jgi:hypothetical protein
LTRYRTMIAIAMRNGTDKLGTAFPHSGWIVLPR